MSSGVGAVGFCFSCFLAYSLGGIWVTSLYTTCQGQLILPTKPHGFLRVSFLSFSASPGYHFYFCIASHFRHSCFILPNVRVAFLLSCFIFLPAISLIFGLDRAMTDE